MTRYYKVLKSDGTSPFQGTPWLLPKDDQPGEWMPALYEDRLTVCEYGYHACTADQLVAFWAAHRGRALGGTLYEVELAGRVLHAPGLSELKHVASRARLLPASWKWDQIASAVDPAEAAFYKTADQAWLAFFEVQGPAWRRYSAMVYPGVSVSRETTYRATKAYDEAIGPAEKAREKTLVRARRLRDKTEAKILAGMGIT